MSDVPYEGYCDECREERGLKKGRRRYSAECNLCGTWTLLWRDVPQAKPPSARPETKFKKAKDLVKGDRFSRGGSYKIYEARTGARSDPAFAGKVMVTVKDGTRDRIPTRMDENSICTVYISNEKEEEK